MDVGFEDQRLGTLCNSDKRLRDTFGDNTALNLQRLLWSLKAAPSLADVSSAPPVARRCIEEGAIPVFAAGPSGSAHLVFTPIGEFDALESITSITIQDIKGRK